VLDIEMGYSREQGDGAYLALTAVPVYNAAPLDLLIC